MISEPPYVEKELLQQIASGNKTAFRELFNLLWPNVYTTALKLTKSPELSQDLAQEVFLRLWENRASLPGVTNLYGFLYRITRNLVTDFLRKKVFQEKNKAFLRQYYELNEADPFHRTELKEQKLQLEKAIQELPDQLKQVVQLAYFENKSHKEIAELIGITPASSRIYLVRAIAMLRKNSGSENRIWLKLLWLTMVT